MPEPKIALKGTVESEKTVSVSIGDDLTFRARGDRPSTPREMYSFDVAMEAFRHAVLYKDSSPNLTIEHTKAGTNEIPVLLLHKEKAVNLPTVIFVHGYTNSKITSIRLGVSLAQAGFFTVLVDARMHGERRPKNFEQKFRTNFAKTFLQVLRGTVTDISKLVDHFSRDKRADIERLGIAGISMGGFTTFLAATTDKRFKAAVSLIGSPDLQLIGKAPSELPPDEKTMAALKKYSPLLNHEKMKHVALLVQNGAKDKVVVPAGPRRLEKVVTKPANTLRAYRYIEYPELEHEVPDIMISRTVTWLEKFL